ncbi:39S ribosomal protein L53, mitochondrial [Anoplophora glabripennis]|nr:39S ribosomal protein L53, mitochondrial [Anoplophora glabripennis]
MSIYFSGTFKRSAGVISAITKQLKLINLKPVRRIQVQFDPFHPNAITARDFLFHISSPKVVETNLNCVIKTNVVCDRSEPQINIDLQDSGSIKFLANNLTVLEILQQINKHISSKVVQEPVVQEFTTKLLGKKQKKR